MCGILGALASRGRWSLEQFGAALDTISHRGPDAAGLEIVGQSGDHEIVFGHRRLAIIDLSAAANQPMRRTAPDGSELSLVFNGELYNFRALRAELAGMWTFTTDSDTEVMLAGLWLMGPSFLERANGMFALAFCNPAKGELLLARDRLGKKPLYYAETSGGILFASELKALTPLLSNLTIDESALVLYRWLGYVPGERSIYEQCRKLPAGSYGLTRIGDPAPRLTIKPFWDPLAAFARTPSFTLDAAADELQALLDDALQIRLEADVPVGLFLSGGIDSSLVAATLARVAPTRAQVFTMQPADQTFDESSIAIATARQLGLPIEVLKLDPSCYDQQIARIPWQYDEPFSDSSQIPTLALSELAAQHVTVILTGDGGDEAFLGYPRFRLPEEFARLSRYLIGPARRLARGMCKGAFGEFLLRAASVAKNQPATNLDFKLARIREMLDAHSLDEIYDRILAMGSVEYGRKKREIFGNATLSDLARTWYPSYSWDALQARTQSERFAALDMLIYLRDDVLVKVDRATMAFGLEARAPLLDYRIVELGCSLPAALKMVPGQDKLILRHLLRRSIGGTLTALPKRGFGIPMPSLKEGGGKLDRYSAWNRFVEHRWRERWAQ